MEIIVLVAVLFFVCFAIFMWSDENKNGEAVRSRHDFIARLDARLRRQFLHETVFANTNDELIESFRKYLTAYSNAFGFDASGNGEIEFLKAGLKEIEKGNLSTLKTIIIRTNLDSDEDLSFTMDRCQEKLFIDAAENDSFKAILSDIESSFSDSMSLIIKMVNWSESKAGALEEVQENVHALVLCIYRFIFQFSSDIEIRNSEPRIALDKMIETSEKKTVNLSRRTWPLYKTALIHDQKSKRENLFSREAEETFCKLIRSRPLVGHENNNDELLSRICSIVVEKSFLKGKKSIRYTVDQQCFQLPPL